MQYRGQRGQYQCEQAAPLHTARHRVGVLRSNRLGDHGIEGEQHTHAEDRHTEEVKIAYGDRCEVRGRYPTDHDRVDRSHRHHADLDQRDRKR